MGKLFIFSAASGTGKTSLAHELMKRVRNLAFSVSHTTRAPRPGETHGVHYYFVSPAEFERQFASQRKCPAKRGKPKAVKLPWE